MAKDKKYYWLKLKEDFFEEKQIKYLRKLPDGDRIVIAYLKMQLKSLKTEGFIKYDRIFPSNVEELAVILDEDINIVTLLIKALQQVGAIEILDDGSFYMIAMQDLIGKEGASAERVRKFREREKKQEIKVLQCNSDVTKCNTEKEIEIEIDKDIESEKEKEKEKEKIHFAEFVTMTNAEYERLVSTYGKDFTDQCIEKLDNYKGSKGKKYKSDYRAIRNWVVDELKKKNEQINTSGGNPFFDILRKEGKM